MFKCINGYTKQMMKDVITKKNNGLLSYGYIYNADLEFGMKGVKYYGENYNFSFVGAFIPDTVYDMSMENTNIACVLWMWPDLANCMPLSNEGMLELWLFERGISVFHTDDLRERACKWIDKYVAE